MIINVCDTVMKTEQDQKKTVYIFIYITDEMVKLYDLIYDLKYFCCPGW